MAFIVIDDTHDQAVGGLKTFGSPIALTGITPAPALAGAGEGRIYWDPDDGEFKHSDDGGAWLPFGGDGLPGGNDTNIQFNDSGSFGGSDLFTWDGTGVALVGIAQSGAGSITGLRIKDSVMSTLGAYLAVSGEINGYGAVVHVVGTAVDSHLSPVGMQILWGREGNGFGTPFTGAARNYGMAVFNNAHGTAGDLGLDGLSLVQGNVGVGAFAGDDSSVTGYSIGALCDASNSTTVKVGAYGRSISISDGINIGALGTANRSTGAGNVTDIGGLFVMGIGAIPEPASTYVGFRTALIAAGDSGEGYLFSIYEGSGAAAVPKLNFYDGNGPPVMELFGTDASGPNTFVSEIDFYGKGTGAIGTNKEFGYYGTVQCYSNDTIIAGVIRSALWLRADNADSTTMAGSGGGELAIQSSTLDTDFTLLGTGQSYFNLRGPVIRYNNSPAGAINTDSIDIVWADETGNGLSIFPRDDASVLLQAIGDDAAVDIRYATKGVGLHSFRANTVDQLHVDANATALETGLLIAVAGGALSRVSIGVNDSGGVGFRVLRIPN